ncbi:MAG: cytochrome d ubiquinol oxidase subunit II [Parachlamydiales bacterium]|nr:cytochrome d ubiquinol oxidase subunit II [Parachlamydiales bacterium]
MSDLEGLQIFWFMVIIVSVIGYSVLDGFDLGVGVLHWFAKGDTERRVFLNAIGPVWDGNEVWLVVLVGSLFAGFPGAYATLLSSFYMPTTILIAGLICRAVSIEFRSKQESKVWRAIWDTLFTIGSLIIAFGAGVLIGNLVSGIPLNHEGDFVGDFWVFFHPYALLIGLTTVACFTMHGCIYLIMKTEGELHDKIRNWAKPTILIFVCLYFLTTVMTLVLFPHMVQRMHEEPYLFLLPLMSLACILNVPRMLHKQYDGRAFAFSCLSIALLIILFALGTYPNLVRSSILPETNSVNITNAGASEMTLIVLAIVVCVGIPLVIGYGFLLYRVFKGKVKIGKMSY